MKIFLVILVIGAGVFYWQSKSRTAATDAEKAKTRVTLSATPRPVYEHDWAKHSLDRVHAVTDQVAKTRKANEQP